MLSSWNRSCSWVSVCYVKDVLKHGEDTAEVRAFPEHLATSGADIEERYPRQEAGGNGVELYGFPPGKGQGVGVQTWKGGPLTLKGVPGEVRGHTGGHLLILLLCVVSIVLVPQKSYKTKYLNFMTLFLNRQKPFLHRDPAKTAAMKTLL